jgi:NADH:ubiquinone oxidoreductase subunit 5 (subunit L)/multisubunit Na+/H+ antiporter MnhA subunit
MEKFLLIFILIPLTGFMASLFMPKSKETWIARVAFYTTLLQLSAAIAFSIHWLINYHHFTVHAKEFVLYKTTGYEYFIELLFDKMTMVYLLVGALLSFTITSYSRIYLHREKGYKRFFNNLLFFFFGYNLVIFSGNFETLFIGWEILGVSSFLLIAFYRDRYLPVKNAVKVFSIYRIGDVGILLAMWMSHHLWHENTTFLKLSQYEIVHEHLQQHSGVGVFISLMILVAAMAKSAQFPFSSWLPRAMEGPTPSSAIFYGSLSVHMGVFLLLRTFPFWEHQFSIRILIAVIGIATTIITTGIARVQSSIKSQIAYSSTAQIGIIFVEIAAGWHIPALIHFAGNAFLRSYQLLVSPSVVTYLIREQFYNYTPHQQYIESAFPTRLANTLYILSLKEWQMDALMKRFLWQPLKKVGAWVNIVSVRQLLLFSIPFLAAGILLLYRNAWIPVHLKGLLPLLYALVGLLLVVKAFTERRNTRLSWLFVMMNHLWIAVAISLNSHFYLDHNLLYLTGILISGLVGYACLEWLMKREKTIGLNMYHGHAYEYPGLALVFLMASLGLIAFPITPSFIGEDLIFSHITEKQLPLAMVVALCYIVDSLAVIRIYARVFLGPHVKSYHETAYRSS